MLTTRQSFYPDFRHMVRLFLYTKKYTFNTVKYNLKYI